MPIRPTLFPRYLLTALVASLFALPAWAGRLSSATSSRHDAEQAHGSAGLSQRFYNLTARDLRIDSLLPRFTRALPLPASYADSIYKVSLSYPEFIDMPAADIAAYRRLLGDVLPPAMPEVRTAVVVDRKRGVLEVAFCPAVYREGRWQWLVSFALTTEGRSAKGAAQRTRGVLRGTPPRPLSPTPSAQRPVYAATSVLATGKWAKIRVSQTGVCQLTADVVRRAGFTSPETVRIFGYGGAVQPEALTADYLAQTDDLQETPSCLVGGRRLFYAKGPVAYADTTAAPRQRNPYSSYGYYFLTEDGTAPTLTAPDEFLNAIWPAPDDYHTLYERDGFAFYQGGSDLYDPEIISAGASKDYTFQWRDGATRATAYVNVASAGTATVDCAFNSHTRTNSIALREYDFGSAAAFTFLIDSVVPADTIRVSARTAPAGLHLDRIELTWDVPAPAPDLEHDQFPAAEYACNITNQNHHADPPADLIIIAPTSRKLWQEAERLKTFHEQHDKLRVNLVSADELYNEFSSGTPDAAAYRRYAKMLYDRAQTEADMPRALLLFGACLWDNRMLTPATAQLSPDDYLLCHENNNAFNKVYSIVNDGYFALLDDGEGAAPETTDKEDIGVGRFPVSTAADAATMVDKVISYATNANAGAWQNTLMFMADDGNDNTHMHDVDEVAEAVAARFPGYLIKKVYWDAYQREQSATGASYPEAERLIKRQQQAGALVMDYGGHGSELQLSEEQPLRIEDFRTFTGQNLPLWVTAACDIMPFDGTSASIGETAVLAKGTCVAFFGTARTVYADRNKLINKAFLLHVLDTEADGSRVMIGEAVRRAKNDLVDDGADRTFNKLHYALLGDPALCLNTPTLRAVIDTIGALPADGSLGTPQLRAGDVVRVCGHIAEAAGADPEPFAGTFQATVRDAQERVVCRLNDPRGADEPFEYNDRPKTLYSGNGNVMDGRFEFRFAVPRDISYADAAGMMTVHAADATTRQLAHGSTTAFEVGGSVAAPNDSIGPSVWCYLNAPSFQNGGDVNPTPYFVAQITDANGINASGSGIGHDLTLIIDGEPARTYNLNDNFLFDFGSYTAGTASYSVPELAAGAHRLVFRAWDVENNCSETQLDFNVVPNLEPNLFSVACSDNPAHDATTFIINHDRPGSEMDVQIRVYDPAGRMLWQHSETGVPSGAYTVKWDLTTGGGQRLDTGVYLYRVAVSSGGSKSVSKARKLIVVN